MKRATFDLGLSAQKHEIVVIIMDSWNSVIYLANSYFCSIITEVNNDCLREKTFSIEIISEFGT